MLRVASQRRIRNPQRQRGIALLTIRSGEICVLAHDAQLGDEVEYSAEESLADTSGYEKTRNIKPGMQASRRCNMCSNILENSSFSLFCTVTLAVSFF